MTLRQTRRQSPSRNSTRAATAGRELWARRQKGADPAADASRQSAQGVGSGLGRRGMGCAAARFLVLTEANRPISSPEPHPTWHPRLVRPPPEQLVGGNSVACPSNDRRAAALEMSRKGLLALTPPGKNCFRGGRCSRGRSQREAGGISPIWRQLWIRASADCRCSKHAASDTEPTVFPGIILFLTYWFLAEYRARMVGRFMAAIPISTVIDAPIRTDPWHGRDLGAQGLAMAVSLRRPADGSAVLS
jgi:hypothetical protein